MKRLLLILLVLFPLFAHSQKIDPTKWTVTYSKNEVKVGDKVDIILSITIDQDWYMYSVGDNPPQASITFVKHPSFSIVGKIKEGPGVKAKHDDNLEIDVRYYEHKAEFRQTIKILKTNPVVEIEVEGQACSTVNGQCVRVSKGPEDLKLPKLKVTAAATNIDNADSLKAKIDSANKVNESVKDVKKDSIAAANNKGAIPINPAEKYFNEFEQKADDLSLIALILLAFGGGIVSLLTPCVFPMVPLTVTFFTNASKSKGEAFKKAFIYGSSIVFIFTIIGLLIAWTVGPDFATFLSNHWIPNLIFFIIFIFFGFSFLGMYEITLPSSFLTKVDAQSEKGGYVGIFFMALTLVLVSFSCTAPIVSPLLIEAAKGQALKPILGMLSYSTAFALPFTLFALFPKLLEKLPKSGGWMNVIKVTLGFIEVALAFKFLSSVDRVYALGILDRDIFLAIWIVVFFLLGVYLLGKIRLPHDDEIKFISVGRLLLAMGVFVFVVYLIPGLFGAPLRALSGVLPPMSSHSFDLPGIVRQYSVGVSENGKSEKALCDDPKYAKKFKMPHGLSGYFDYDQALKCAKEKKKPLFIDFTGHNCANCIRMEENVWSDPDVLSTLRNEFVLVSLYTDDQTRLPENEVYVSPYDKKKKKTLGDKYYDLELGKFKSTAFPYYIILDPYTEKPLVKPVGYVPSIVDYLAFLKEGANRFKKIHP